MIPSAIACTLFMNVCTERSSESCTLGAERIPKYVLKFQLISNGNRTEWSLIRSVIIRVITKSDDRAAGVRFVYHEYDYRLNWTTQSSIIN